MNKHTPKFNRRPKPSQRVKSNAKIWLDEYITYLYDMMDDTSCNKKVLGV